MSVPSREKSLNKNGQGSKSGVEHRKVRYNLQDNNNAVGALLLNTWYLK